jgi:hypothetical protein
MNAPNEAGPNAVTADIGPQVDRLGHQIDRTLTPSSPADGRTAALTPETAAKYEELALLAEHIAELAGAVADHANRLVRGEGDAADAEAISALTDRFKGPACDMIAVRNSIDAGVR